MTQAEKLIARLQSRDESSLYEIIVYITAEKTIGFWVVKKQPVKLEGEPKREMEKDHICDIIPITN